VNARTAAFVDLAESDLKAMGWTDPRAAARLAAAMAEELVMSEMTAGEPDRAGRAVLWTTLERMDLPGSQRLNWTKSDADDRQGGTEQHVPGNDAVSTAQ
jgi:hypothetical protein